MIGHSIGGLIGGHYFNKYHKKVIKLLLLSPAGVNDYVEGDREELEKHLKHFGFFKKKLYNFTSRKIFKDKNHPYFLIENVKFLKSFFIDMYMDSKRMRMK